MKNQVTIEVLSDFICPWCYIGKIRLNRIKEVLQNELTIHIKLRPYVLYPHIPPEGSPKSEFATKTKPGMGRSLRAEAEIEDISLNYKKIDRIPYSVEAHRLIELINDPQLEWEMSLAIFEAYFEHGLDIGDRDVLKHIAENTKVPQSIITQFYISEDGKIATDQKLIEIKKEYVSVVPSLKFNNAIWLNGLQSDDVWINYIRRSAKMGD